MWLLPRALSDVLFPRVARLDKAADGHQQEMVETKSLRHVSLMTVVSAVVLAVGLSLLVVPVFGSAFEDSIRLGLFLIPGTAAIGVSSVLAATVVGRGRPASGLYVALVVTPLTVAMYATLIPWLEADGAAIASSISYIATFVLWCALYQRATGRRVLPLLVPTRAEFHDIWSLRHKGGRTASRRAA
jgi:O-antigen/teichoic acid export membrane protein